MLTLVRAWFVVLLATHPVSEDRFVNAAAAVDFTHHSSVDASSAPKYKIRNFIRNNRDRDPLSVKWKEAGIFAVGFLQIPPGATDYGNSGYTTYNPALAKSQIQYGVALQQATPAEVYIDVDQQRDKNTDLKTTEYIRKDRDGKEVFRIALSSRIAPEGKRSELTFDVYGGVSLAIPMKLGGYLKKDNSVLDSKSWKLMEVEAVEKFGLRDGSYSDLAKEWLRTNDQVGYKFFVTLQNLSREGNRLVVSIVGARWQPEKIYLIAFNSDRSGMIGLMADVYLPQ